MNGPDLSACVAPETDLGPDDAFAIIQPYFDEWQALWIEQGFKRVKKTRLYVAPWIHDSPRHFAATRDDGKAILVAPEFVDLPEETVRAILSHEFGHATDFLYPGEFALGPGRRALRRSRADFTDEQWAKWMRSWENRDKDLVELTADAIAELVTGRRIGYTGPCLLQAFDRGRARPEGLR